MERGGWVGEMQNKALLSQLGCSCQLGLKLGLAELGNIAIIVRSYNQTTRNISGQLVENWLKKNKEKWCLDKLRPVTIRYEL